MTFKKWLPHLLTLVLAVLLVLTQHLWAAPFVERLAAQESTTPSSKTSVNYQGYLTDAAGNPVNDSLDMVFRLYDAETEGTALWSETQFGVPVVDGLFSVLLGSVNPLSQPVFDLNPDLWLGITVGSDEEMAPRDKIASAPYALTTGLPQGVIVMWSGSVATIPDGWILCDGTEGTPDLRDQFVVGAGNLYSVGDTGGVISSTLTIEQMPVHAHTASASIAGNHNHYYLYHDHSDSGYANGSLRGDRYSNSRYTDSAGSHTHDIVVDEAGGGQPHENRPPYYSLAFICKQ